MYKEAHSSLLKYLISPGTTNTLRRNMADQHQLPSKHHQLQIQTIGFSNLDNGRIHSEVPEEQPVRIDQNKPEYPIRDHNHPVDVDKKDNLEITGYEDEPEEDKYTYTPVLTVTKNEITLTKGELKLQKIIVQEADRPKATPNVIKATEDFSLEYFNPESKNERNIVSVVPGGPFILRETLEKEEFNIDQNKKDNIAIDSYAKTNPYQEDNKRKDVQVTEGNANETNDNEADFESLNVSESEKTVGKPEIEVKEQEEEVVYNKPVSRLPKRIPAKSSEPPKKETTKESKEVKQTGTSQPFHPPNKHVGRKNIHSEAPSEPHALRQEPPTKTTSKIPKFSKHEVKTESKIPKSKSESKVKLDAKAKTEAKADVNRPKDKPRKTFKQKVLNIINIKDNSHSDNKSNVPDSSNEIRFSSEQDNTKNLDQQDSKHASDAPTNEDTSNSKDPVDNEPKQHATTIKRVVENKELDPLRQFGHSERNSVIIEQIIGSEVPKEIDDIFEELYDSLAADKILDEVEIGLPVITKEEVKFDEPVKVGVALTEQTLRQEKRDNVLPEAVILANKEEPTSMQNTELSQEIEKTEDTIPNSENAKEHDANNFEGEISGPQSILEITNIANHDVRPHQTTSQDVRHIDQEQYETYHNEIRKNTENENDDSLNEINKITDNDNTDIPQEVLNIEQVEKHETIDNIKDNIVFAANQITPQKDSGNDISKHSKESETIHIHHKNEFEIKHDPHPISKYEEEIALTDIKDIEKESEESLPHTDNAEEINADIMIQDKDVNEISENIEEVRKDLHSAYLSERDIRLETNEIAKDKEDIPETKSFQAIDAKEDIKKDDHGSVTTVPVMISTPNDLHDNMKPISKDITEKNTPFEIQNTAKTSQDVENIENVSPKVIEEIKENISDKSTEEIPEKPTEHIIQNAENVGDVISKDVVNIEKTPDKPIESDDQLYTLEQATFNKDIIKDDDNLPQQEENTENKINYLGEENIKPTYDDIPKTTEVSNNYFAGELQTTEENQNEDHSDLPKDIEITKENIINETIELKAHPRKTTKLTEDFKKEAEDSPTVILEEDHVNIDHSITSDAEILEEGRKEDIDNKDEMLPHVKQMPQDSQDISHDVQEITHPVKEIIEDVTQTTQDVEQMPQNVNEIPQDVKEMPHLFTEIAQGVTEISQDVKQIPQDGNEIALDAKEIIQDVKEVQHDVTREPQDVKVIQEVTSTDVETIKEVEDDSVYTPVLTVTKKETVLRSPTVKLQKITVDEKFEDGATPRDEDFPIIKTPEYVIIKDGTPLSPEIDLSKPNYRDTVRQKMKEISDRSSTDSNQIDKMKRDANVPKEVKYPPKEYVRVKTLDDAKINRDIYKPKIVDHLPKRDVTDENANENTDSMVGNNISTKRKDNTDNSTEEKATMDFAENNFKKIDDETNEVPPISIKGRVKKMINKIVSNDKSPNGDIKKKDNESKVDKTEESSDKSNTNGMVKSALKRFESKDESVSKDTTDHKFNENRQTEEVKPPKKKIFAILSMFENKQSNIDRSEFKKSTEHINNNSREVIWEKTEFKPKHFKSEDDLAKEASKGKVKHILKAIEANQVGLSKGKSMENIPRTLDFRREFSRRKSVSETIAMFEVGNI